MFFVILLLKSKSKVLDNLKINIHQHKQKMHEDSLGLPRKPHKYSVNYLVKQAIFTNLRSKKSF